MGFPPAPASQCTKQSGLSATRNTVLPSRPNVHASCPDDRKPLCMAGLHAGLNDRGNGRSLGVSGKLVMLQEPRAQSWAWVLCYACQGQPICNMPGLAADAAFLLVYFGPLALPLKSLFSREVLLGDARSALLVMLVVRCLLGLALLGLAGCGDGDLMLRGAEVGLRALGLACTKSQQQHTQLISGK